MESQQTSIDFFTCPHCFRDNQVVAVIEYFNENKEYSGFGWLFLSVLDNLRQVFLVCVCFVLFLKSQMSTSATGQHQILNHRPLGDHMT